MGSRVMSCPLEAPFGGSPCRLMSRQLFFGKPPAPILWISVLPQHLGKFLLRVSCLIQRCKREPKEGTVFFPGRMAEVAERGPWRQAGGGHVAGGVGPATARLRAERLAREPPPCEVAPTLWGLGSSLIREDFNIHPHEELKRVLKPGTPENRATERGSLRGTLLEAGAWGHGLPGGSLLGRATRWGSGSWCSQFTLPCSLPWQLGPRPCPAPVPAASAQFAPSQACRKDRSHHNTPFQVTWYGGRRSKGWVFWVQSQPSLPHLDAFPQGERASRARGISTSGGSCAKCRSPRGVKVYRPSF